MKKSLILFTVIFIWLLLFLCISEIKTKEYQVKIDFKDLNQIHVNKKILIENSFEKNVTLGKMYVPVVLANIDPELTVSNLRMREMSGTLIPTEFVDNGDSKVIEFDFWQNVTPGKKISLILDFDVSGVFTTGMLFKDFKYPAEEFTLPIGSYSITIVAPPNYRITYAEGDHFLFKDSEGRYSSAWKYKSSPKSDATIELTNIPLPVFSIKGMYIFWGTLIFIVLLINIALLFRKPKHIDIKDLVNEAKEEEKREEREKQEVYNLLVQGEQVSTINNTENIPATTTPPQITQGTNNDQFTPTEEEQ